MESAIQVSYLSHFILVMLISLVIGGIIVSLIMRSRVARLEGQILISREFEAKTNALLEKVNSEKEKLTERCAALAQKSAINDENHKAQIAFLTTNRNQIAAEFENLANRIFDEKQKEFVIKSKSTIEDTLTPLRRDIGDFRKQVESSYDKEAADRNILVGKISELQKQTQQVSSDALTLASALRGDNKVQGNWGEFILEKLLEDSGLTKGREYTTQANKTDEEGRRRAPDVVVHLPEGRDIIIDSKISLVAYEAYHNSESNLQKSRFLKKHLASMKAHIRVLSEKKYETLDGVNSLDFVLIFVPIEGAFLLALDQGPELMTDAYDRGIILVSPTTLMATLRTIKNIWRYADQNQNALVIAERAGKLYDQFALYVESLDEVSKHLARGTESLSTARKRLLLGRGNLIQRTEELRVLGAKAKKEIPQPTIPDQESHFDS